MSERIARESYTVKFIGLEVGEATLAFEIALTGISGGGVINVVKPSSCV